VQVLVLNNLNLGGYINPWLYVLFILILPVEIPNWLLLVLAFVTGCSWIPFSTPLACMPQQRFSGLFTPLSFEVFSPRDGYEPGSLPVPSHFGLGWFLKYAIACCSGPSSFSVYCGSIFL
jgi:hypothetical protein